MNNEESQQTDETSVENNETLVESDTLDSTKFQSDNKKTSVDTDISDTQQLQPNEIKSHSTQLADNEARLEQLEKEHETLKNQYMRIAADFDNFRKRQSKDNDDLKVQLTCSVLTEILPVIDNFERARQQLTPEGEEAQALHRSYQGLYKQLVDVLKKLGVAPMRVVGQKFDPSLHEAVMREPSENYKEDIIIEELQRGYHLEGRVIRHALVKVSMGPGPKESKSEDNVELDNSNNSDESVSISEDKTQNN